MLSGPHKLTHKSPCAGEGNCAVRGEGPRDQSVEEEGRDSSSLARMSDASRTAVEKTRSLTRQPPSSLLKSMPALYTRSGASRPRLFTRVHGETVWKIARGLLSVLTLVAP